METKITKEILSNFTYEITERIVRFIVHLEEIEVQFYSDSSRFKVKVDLIDNYKKTLYKLLSVVLVGYKKDINLDNTNNYPELFNILKDTLKAINELHADYLSILPRPSEPVELTRFERVIHKQIVRLTNEEMKQELSISIYEKIGEEICSDPLNEYKASSITPLFTDYNITNRYGIDGLTIKDIDKEDKVHITIPRIDASNTFRWASMIHEMAHSLLKYVFKNSIEEEFLNSDFLNDKNKDTIFNGFFKNNDNSAFPTTDTLRKWLEECWCDLFASVLIGPSLYFSQYLAFINEKEKKHDNDYIDHPPSTFRLDLIESLLCGRFPIELYEGLTPSIGNCEGLLSLLQENNAMSFEKKPEMRSIYNAFCLFFKSHFISNQQNKKSGEISLKNNNEINERLTSLVNKYVRIHPEVINQLVGRLNKNLPIPSVRILNEENKYQEIPTYVQEIFLASWISRCENIQPQVLKIVNELSDEECIDIGKIEKPYLEIKKIILRHDQAVLKSIQVSEWFDFLIQEKIRPEVITVFKNKDKENIEANGILVDEEIESLILQDELKIIPLMYFNQINSNGEELKQIGTTSIDIRLGTSFQVFYPEQYGIIDFTEEDNNTMTSSNRINLDFIEGITITPGQFLLGHSMEYVKLPDNFCGNLEGRSSFARLGIEIHMTAGFIDPGFEGVITFEIYNAGPTTVKLYPGMRIGQLRFERNSNPKEKYLSKHSVKYKGLLEHNLSKQSKDFEVELIKRYKRKEEKIEIEKEVQSIKNKKL